MRHSALVMGLCLALAVACTAGGKIIYVDDDANAPGDGKSWATAYRYLQDALQEGEPLPPVADPCDLPTKKGRVRSLHVRSVGRVTIASDPNEPIEIRVAQGVHRPDRGIRQKPGDRLATFRLTSRLALKGGYAGIGTPDPNARDRRLHETILSGDLTSNDVAVDDPCDLEHEPSRAENSYHVVYIVNADATTLLEGFTVTGGYAWERGGLPRDPPYERYTGGGVRCSRSTDPTIAKCTFKANFADSGGGIYNDASNPRIVSCLFVLNAAASAGGFGGGMAGGGSPTVNNCTFSRNYAVGGGGRKQHRGGTKVCFLHFHAQPGREWRRGMDG